MTPPLTGISQQEQDDAITASTITEYVKKCLELDYSQEQIAEQLINKIGQNRLDKILPYGTSVMEFVGLVIDVYLAHTDEDKTPVWQSIFSFLWPYIKELAIAAVREWAYSKVKGTVRI